MLFGSLRKDIPLNFYSRVIKFMRNDEITEIFINDKTVIKLEELLYEKYGSAQKGLIRQVMRHEAICKVNPIFEKN